MKTKPVALKLCWLGLLLSLCIARAGNLAVDQSSLDGGGGTSSGGRFSVTGSVGQPDAGAMSGGRYALTGGFWSLVEVVQTPGAPVLTVTRNPAHGAVTISWVGTAEGWLLERLDSLAGPPVRIGAGPAYQTNGNVISYTETVVVGKRFFRLSKP